MDAHLASKRMRPGTFVLSQLIGCCLSPDLQPPKKKLSAAVVSTSCCKHVKACMLTLQNYVDWAGHFALRTTLSLLTLGTFAG